MRFRKDKDESYFVDYIKNLKHKEFIAMINAMAKIIEDMTRDMTRTKDSADTLHKKSKRTSYNREGYQ